MMEAAQQVPSSTQTTQEQRGSGQHEEDEALEDKAVVEEELAQVQQEIERLRQEQENNTRMRAATQCAQARQQQIKQNRKRLIELQQAINTLR
jgi:hypothetical protein